MASITLKTPSLSYDIHIAAGLLRTLYPRLKKLYPAKKSFRPIIVTSENIWALWSKDVLASFPEPPTVLFHPVGEKHKRLAAVEKLADQMVKAGADRDTLLLALGGGVVGDLTGFLAAIYMRGIPYVQLPTTLLAQVDSSLGGKTGVNLATGKNLIGSFHHPLAVFSDTNVLATLPPAELRAGLHESIKAGVIYDPKLFKYMQANSAAILAADPAALTKVVTASVKVKADVVGQDEKENGLRMILNFGHTLGHAIEAATQYKQLLHGEAVAWGSIAAVQLAVSRDALSEKDANAIVNTILAYGPLPGFRAKAADLVRLTAGDKKRRSGRRAFVLPRSIGTVEVVYDVTDAELLSAANSMLTLMKAQA